METLHAGVLFIFHRLRYNRLCSRNNVWIMPGCFDKGLVIGHLQNIVVSAAVKVGKDCTILHNSTIGVSFTRKGVPAIGDNVLICSGAGVFGDIMIADDVVIGANAVVTKSCMEKGVTLAGVPARIIKDSNDRI